MAFKLMNNGCYSVRCSSQELCHHSHYRKTKNNICWVSISKFLTNLLLLDILVVGQSRAKNCRNGRKQKLTELKRIRSPGASEDVTKVREIGVQKIILR